MLPELALTLALTLPIPAQEPCVPVSVVQNILAKPPHDGATKALLWSGSALAMMDLSRSMYEIGAGRAYEANPAMAHLQRQPEAFALAKFAGYAVVTGAILAIKPKHPKAALWGAILYNAISAGVVIHNYRTSQQWEGR